MELEDDCSVSNDKSPSRMKTIQRIAYKISSNAEESPGALKRLSYAWSIVKAPRNYVCENSEYYSSVFNIIIIIIIIIIINSSSSTTTTTTVDDDDDIENWGDFLPKETPVITTKYLWTFI